MKNKKNKVLLILTAILLLYLLLINNIIVSSKNIIIEKIDPQEYLINDNVVYSISDIYIEENDLSQPIIISGWAFCETLQNNSNKYINVIITNDINAYKSSISKLAKRADITYEYLKKGKNIQGDNHEFGFFLPTINLKNGIYKIYLEVYENENSNGICYINCLLEKDKYGIRIIDNEI